MKNVQSHVYLPEQHLAAIRKAAKVQLRTPQNLLSFLLQKSQHYQKIVQEYADPTKPEQPRPLNKTNDR